MASASFVVFQVSSLGYDEVDLLLISLLVICMSFVSQDPCPHIVLSAVKPCSPLLLPPLSVYLPTLVHSVPYPSPSSALKSPTIGM